MRQPKEKIQEIADNANALLSVGRLNLMFQSLGLPHSNMGIREAWDAGRLNECPECAGNGYVPVNINHGIQTVECPTCNGERWVK